MQRPRRIYVRICAQQSGVQSIFDDFDVFGFAHGAAIFWPPIEEGICMHPGTDFEKMSRREDREVEELRPPPN
jgi:hypothetical protein